jgi:hypothetical protein
MHKQHQDNHHPNSDLARSVTVRVFVMLDIHFVSVKYVFVSIKLMCVCVRLLKIKVQVKRVFL